MPHHTDEVGIRGELVGHGDAHLRVALVVAVLGLVAAISRPIMKLAAGESLAWNAATISQAVMALGCAAAIVSAAMFLLSPPGKP